MPLLRQGEPWRLRKKDDGITPRGKRLHLSIKLIETVGRGYGICKSGGESARISEEGRVDIAESARRTIRRWARKKHN